MTKQYVSNLVDSSTSTVALLEHFCFCINMRRRFIKYLAINTQICFLLWNAHQKWHMRSGGSMYVQNSNVVQIVGYCITLSFFLVVLKCVFLIIWKCICSLVKTSSCFHANNQHNGLHVYFYHFFSEKVFSYLVASGSSNTCNWLEWPIFVTQFPIYLYLPFLIWWLLPYQNNLHFVSLCYIVKWIKMHTIFDMSNLLFSSVDFV